MVPEVCPGPRRILLLVHAFNCLSQRLYVELAERGHRVSVELDIHESITREAVELFQPDLILAPYLRRAIPESIWRQVPCLVVHPGPPGDRGPSALDWAILDEASSWGVTVLRAIADLDAGPVLAARGFPMRSAAKSSLYRREVTEAAVEAVLEALELCPLPPSPSAPEEKTQGTWRPQVRPRDRAIDWQRDSGATLLRKLRSADGQPGLRDPLWEETGRSLVMFDGRLATSPTLIQKGQTLKPGTLFARNEAGALCRATVDGALWIGQAQVWLEGDPPATVKLSAVEALASQGESGTLAALPVIEEPNGRGSGDIWLEEQDGVGFLHFPFFNGAMSTGQCQRLTGALLAARQRPLQVLVLMGGEEFWSNGIHLGTIEAATSPADESWANINAMDDLALALLTTQEQLTLAALAGNAGAGGVFLALAADMVHARHGVVLNPHYKGMGNLYGSEYWTYVLPRRIGTARAELVTHARLPMGTPEALRLGLLDAAYGQTVATFRREVTERALALARDPALPLLLAEKKRRRAEDEALKPLAIYRAEELERMKLNFYGFDPSYHVARYNFITKVPKARTPSWLAHHR